jgi:hypothetical protein
VPPNSANDWRIEIDHLYKDLGVRVVGVATLLIYAFALSGAALTWIKSHRCVLAKIARKEAERGKHLPADARFCCDGLDWARDLAMH